METLTLTEFAGLNTKSPIEELPINPVESPNIINCVMEEGTIFCRPPINVRDSFGNGNILAYYQGKLNNDIIQITQVDTVIKTKSGSVKQWWNDNWIHYRNRELKNTSYTDYYNLLCDWRLPIGFDYTNIKANGDDLRFITFEDNSWKELSYYIKEWNKDPTTILATTSIIPTMSLTTQPTEMSNLDFTVAGASAWGNIVIAGKDINNQNLSETLTFTGNQTQTTINKFKSVDINGITTAGFNGGTLQVQYKKETRIYVTIPQIKAQQSLIVQMYYDNATAESKSSPNPIKYFPFNTLTELTNYFNQNIVYPSDSSIWTNIGPYINASPVCLGIYHNLSSVKMAFDGYIDYVALQKTFKNSSVYFQGKFRADHWYDGSNPQDIVAIRFGFVLGNWTCNLWIHQDNLLVEGDTTISKSYQMASYKWYNVEVYYCSKEHFLQAKVWDNDTLIFNDQVPIISSTDNFSFRFGDFAGLEWVSGGDNRVYTFYDEFYIYNFLPDSVTQSPLGIEQTKSPSGAWTDLITGWSSKPTQILQFLNQIIFINEDKPVTIWDGTITQQLPIDQATGKFQCKYGLVHKNRLWLYNFPGSSTSMLRYSDINLIANLKDWQTNGIDNLEYIATDDGTEITGVGIISDGIFIPKQHTGYLWYGDVPNEIVKRLNLDIGCLAHRTIQGWENGDFFLSKKGIHFIRGSVAETPIIFTVDNIQSDNLAEKLQPTFNNFNKDYLQNAIGQMWNDRYYCAVPGLHSMQNNILLILDYKRGWWTYWIPPESITCMFVDDDNIFTIGTNGGHLRMHETRNFMVDELLKEDGQDIQNIYDTGKLDLKVPNVRKRLRFIECVFKGDLTLDLLVDGVSKVNQNISAGSYQGVCKTKIPVLQESKFFQLRFSNLTKQLYSVTLYYEYLRT